MDTGIITAALRTRAQVIAAEEFLEREKNATGPSDHYSDLHRDALSTALKKEQLVEDLLAKRQKVVDQIKSVSDKIGPVKLERAKFLLQKKQELLEKRDELQALLKDKNMTLSDLHACKGRATDHNEKLSRYNELSEDCKELQDYIESNAAT